MSPSATPATERPHVVQLYQSDFSLVDQTTEFLGNSLLAGNSAVVVATDKHRQAFARELRSRVDLSTAVAQGRYLSLDAAKTLSQILRGRLSAPGPVQRIDWRSDHQSHPSFEDR